SIDEIMSLRDTIESSSYSLLSTIEQILEYTRSKDGNLKIIKKSFKLSSVLQNIKTEFVHKGQNRQLIPLIKIEGDPIPDNLIGDAKQLIAILNPLLENTAKFTREKPAATLTLKLLKKTKADILIQFSLTDNGIGIPDEQFEKIFEPFSQVDDSSTREFDGTGMGLSLCKQLVELLDGKIWVKSVMDKGSTFHFTARFELQDNDEYFDILEINKAINSTKVVLDDKTEKPALDVADIEPNLKKLNQALHESEPGNIRKYLIELRKYQISKLSELTEAIDDYEYEEAALLLKRIGSEIGIEIE
ncbi:ATP-binding protein, partial [Desulfobacterales bacterium HSG17]|nr:ATP-binding protein [Desulfobacterales bacterium HSG17]